MKTGSAIPAVRLLVVAFVAAAVGGAVMVAGRLSTEGMVLALAALVFPFVLAIVPNARRFLLAVIVFEIIFRLDISFGFDLHWASLDAYTGWNVSVTTVCIVLLYADWFVQATTRRSRASSGLARAVLPMVAYVSADVLSVAVARNLVLSGFEVNLLLQALLLHVYVAYRVIAYDDARFIIRMLSAAVLLQALLMVAVGTIGHGFAVGPLAARVDPGPRVGGTLGSPNTAAGILALTLAPALALALGAQRNATKLLGTAAFGFGVAALVMTGSRGGWSGFVLSMVIFLPLAARHGWVRLRAVLAGLVIVLALGGVFSSTIAARLTSQQASAPGTRITLMRLAAAMIGDHPVLGVGANNFAVMLPRYVTPQYSRDWIRTVHSKYFLVWAETGAVGLLAFLWYMFGALRQGWKGWRRLKPPRSLLALGLTAGFAGVALHMAVDLFHGRQETELIALVAGILVGLGAHRSAGESYDV